MMKARQTIRIAAVAAVALLGAVSSHAFGGTIASVYASETGGLTSSKADGTSTVTGTVTEILNISAATPPKETYVISDGTGSIVVFNETVPGTPAYTPTVGDNITLTAPNTDYFSAPELGQPTAITLNSSANAVVIPVITVANLNSAESAAGAVAPYAEEVATINDVTVTSAGVAATSIAASGTYTLTDSSGTGTLFGYNSYTATKAGNTALSAILAASPGGPVDITGYVEPYSTTSSEFYVLSATPYTATVTAVPLPKSVPAATAGLLLIGGSAVVRRRRTA